jgi:microcystin degradation protein MlrC
MTRRPRIALLGAMLESNAFADPIGEAEFRAYCWLEGEKILAEAAKEAPAMPAEMVAFIRVAAVGRDWDLVPILLVAAGPAGPAQQGFFEELRSAMVEGLRAAGPVDGVYFAAHGAMTAIRSHDADGILLAAVRAEVGPGTPIVATLDLHANLSDLMVNSTDLLIGYRTNPHVDQVERGAEAARGMMRLLTGERFSKAFVRLPLAPPTVSLLTASGPFADVMKAGIAMVEADPALINVSPLPGFVYSDTPKNGFAILATATNPATAWGAAGRLAAQAWQDRDRFKANLTSLEQAVTRAKAASDDSRLPALLLADVADNPGGGASGNTLFLLKELRRAGVAGCLIGLLHDPKLAQEAAERGVGARFDAVFNRGGHVHFSRRDDMEARVLALSDGNCVGSRGIFAGRSLALGQCAALDVGGITVVVSSLRIQCADPIFFTMLGLDPAAARVVVVKSRGHFRAGFDQIFKPAQILEVDAPGLTSPVLSNFKFRNLPRPIFPLDPETEWRPS